MENLQPVQSSSGGYWATGGKVVLLIVSLALMALSGAVYCHYHYLKDIPRWTMYAAGPLGIIGTVASLILFCRANKCEDACPKPKGTKVKYEAFIVKNPNLLVIVPIEANGQVLEGSKKAFMKEYQESAISRGVFYGFTSGASINVQPILQEITSLTLEDNRELPPFFSFNKEGNPTSLDGQPIYCYADNTGHFPAIEFNPCNPFTLRN